MKTGMSVSPGFSEMKTRPLESEKPQFSSLLSRGCSEGGDSPASARTRLSII